VSHKSSNSLSKIAISLLWLSEHAGIILQFFIFSTLLKNLSRLDFARWESLQIYFGLFLLIPRNGLDIVAIRSANRHSNRMREWTGIVLLCRGILSLPAAILFFLSINQVADDFTYSVTCMSVSILISSITPDTACRAMSRFKKIAFVNIMRNFCFLLLIFRLQSFEQLAIAHLACETFVCLIWWHDCWIHHALPGGRIKTLLQRSFHGILIRSWNQSLNRWLRVLSWNVDALILSAAAPEIWIVISPLRRILMMMVVPFANLTGQLAPNLSVRSTAEIQFVISKLIPFCMIFSMLIAMAAEFIGQSLIRLLFPKFIVPDSFVLFFNVFRFAPFAMGILLSAAFTANRLDSYSLRPSLFQSLAQLLACFIAVDQKVPVLFLGILCFSEIIAVIIVWWQWRSVSEQSVFRSQIGCISRSL
jgi:O-antigen/teichoic acid export membrane protein